MFILLGIILLLFLALLFLWFIDITLLFSIHQPLSTLDQKYIQTPRVDIPERVVISLTTIPSRLDKLENTIKSLLLQTKRVDEIRMNIPLHTMSGIPYILPPWTQNLHHVKIYHPIDEGPGTKFFSTSREEDPSTAIIIVDDDVLYHRRMVENLTWHYAYFKGEAAITTYGHVMNESNLHWAARMTAGLQPVDVIMGVCGTIIPNKKIPKEIFAYQEGPPHANMVDDDWISGWLRYTHTPLYSTGFVPQANIFLNDDGKGLSKTINSDAVNKGNVNKWFLKNHPHIPLLGELKLDIE